MWEALIMGSPLIALAALIAAIVLTVDARARVKALRGTGQRAVSPWRYAAIGLLLVVFLGIGTCWGVVIQSFGDKYP